jgi:phosphoribosylformimino-5-aminoimidazole carboxamide ribonucleotide (ProFAR) isomerase
VTFETLPVLHLDEGRLPEYPGQDPERVLTSLSRRFGRVVLVDVHGVKANDADLEFLQHAARRRPVWMDGGSRYATDAMDLFVAGAEAVTLRWNTIQRVEELEEAADLCSPGTLFLALEFPKGEFLRHPKDKRDVAEVVRLAESKGVGIVYVLDGADETLARSLPGAATPRYVQSAIAPATIQSMGFQGCMLAPTLLPEPEEASP